MDTIEGRRKLAVTLPSPIPHGANDAPVRQSGHIPIVSGQLADSPDGRIAARHKGGVGHDIFNQAARTVARFRAMPEVQ